MMHTKSVKINKAQSLKIATTALKNGKIVIFPTETCYGLAADATNNRAVKKIYALKHRKNEKKMAIACSSLEMASKYVKISREARILANEFMPGPLTIVTKGKSIRIPDNEFTLKMIMRFGKPVTATSANISGQKNLYSISDVVKNFSGKVDVIVDAGDLPRRRASTVIDVDSMKVLRKGSITMKQIKKALAMAY